MNTATCTSRENCPCAFCGSVRLLMEQERLRITWKDETTTDLNTLAEDYIDKLERGTE